MGSWALPALIPPQVLGLMILATAQVHYKSMETYRGIEGYMVEVGLRPLAVYEVNEALGETDVVRIVTFKLFWQSMVAVASSLRPCMYLQPS